MRRVFAIPLARGGITIGLGFAVIIGTFDAVAARFLKDLGGTNTELVLVMVALLIVGTVFAHGTAKPIGLETGTPFTHVPHPRERIEALRKREQAIKAAIAAEQVRRQKRKDKEDARLFSIVGAALVQNAVQSPDFRLMLKQVLQSATLRETDRVFLAGKGWV